jgi:hypothetical protein
MSVGSCTSFVSEESDMVYGSSCAQTNGRCPEVEGIWTCLRVIDDCVVLVFLVPHVCNYEGSGNIGGFVKVFHMPTKSWHTFPDEEYFLWNWDGFRSRDGFQYTDKIGNPFLVEVRFDAVP